MMKNFKKFKNFYLLKISKGEEINKTLANFVKKEAKNGGFFTGLGAVKEITLAYYHLKKKKYIQKKIKKPLELLGLFGNVCFSNQQIIVHSHAIFGDNKFRTIGGHLIEAKVSGACEILFFPFGKKIKKLYDKSTGLKLMKF